MEGFKPDKKPQVEEKEGDLEKQESFSEATKELNSYSQNIMGLKKNLRRLTMILGISIASLVSVAAQAQETDQKAQEPEKTEYSIEEIPEYIEKPGYSAEEMDSVMQEIQSNLDTNNWDEVIRLAEAASKVDTIFNDPNVNTYFNMSQHYMYQTYGENYYEMISVDGAKRGLKMSMDRHDWVAVEGWAKIAKEKYQSKE